MPLARLAVAAASWAVLDAARAIEAEPALLGASAHFMAVARRTAIPPG